MLTLASTGTTLNIQSLMGVVMLQGMVVSNSILIVDFANVLRGEGHSVREAVAHACRIRLRPILMTSLATIVGLAAHGASNWKPAAKPTLRWRGPSSADLLRPSC